MTDEPASVAAGQQGLVFASPVVDPLFFFFFPARSVSAVCVRARSNAFGWFPLIVDNVAMPRRRTFPCMRGVDRPPVIGLCPVSGSFFSFSFGQVWMGVYFIQTPQTRDDFCPGYFILRSLAPAFLQARSGFFS